MTNGFPPILTADQAAEMLHLASGREALKLARERRIPSVRIGKRVLFIRDEVIRTLVEQSRPAISDEEMRAGRT